MCPSDELISNANCFCLSSAPNGNDRLLSDEAAGCESNMALAAFGHFDWSEMSALPWVLALHLAIDTPEKRSMGTAASNGID